MANADAIAALSVRTYLQRFPQHRQTHEKNHEWTVLAAVVKEEQKDHEKSDNHKEQDAAHLEVVAMGYNFIVMKWILHMLLRR
jgi:hypothetical protein